MGYDAGDWIRESTSTTGTGQIGLDGAVASHQSFSVLDNPSCVTYTIEDGVEVEHGIGLYSDLTGIGGGRLLTRQEVLFSTNGGSEINLSGSAEVYCTHSSYLDRLWRTPSPPCVRMSLDSSDPHPSADQSAKTTLYIHRLGGDRVDIYNTTRSLWQPTRQTATLSLTTFSASTMYDIFVYDNSGVLAAEKLAWTNTTTRATGITLNEGRWCKSGDLSRLYIGSVYADGSSQLNDTKISRDVWNFYNRVPRPLLARPTDTGHTYTTATFREWNNGSTLGLTRFSFVVGVGGMVVGTRAAAYAYNGTSGDNGTWAAVGIGLDSATNLAEAYGTWVDFNGVQINAFAELLPAAGYHTCRLLQQSGVIGARVTNWLGVYTTAGAAVQAALSGSFLC